MADSRWLMAPQTAQVLFHQLYAICHLLIANRHCASPLSRQSPGGFIRARFRSWLKPIADGFYRPPSAVCYRPSARPGGEDEGRGHPWRHPLISRFSHHETLKLCAGHDVSCVPSCWLAPPRGREPPPRQLGSERLHLEPSAPAHALSSPFLPNLPWHPPLSYCHYTPTLAAWQIRRCRKRGFYNAHSNHTCLNQPLVINYGWSFLKKSLVEKWWRPR